MTGVTGGIGEPRTAPVSPIPLVTLVSPEVERRPSRKVLTVILPEEMVCCGAIAGGTNGPVASRRCVMAEDCKQCVKWLEEVQNPRKGKGCAIVFFTFCLGMSLLLGYLSIDLLFLRWLGVQNQAVRNISVINGCAAGLFLVLAGTIFFCGLLPLLRTQVFYLYSTGLDMRKVHIHRELPQGNVTDFQKVQYYHGTLEELRALTGEERAALEITTPIFRLQLGGFSQKNVVIGDHLLRIDSLEHDWKFEFVDGRIRIWWIEEQSLLLYWYNAVMIMSHCPIGPDNLVFTLEELENTRRRLVEAQAGVAQFECVGRAILALIERITASKQRMRSPVAQDIRQQLEALATALPDSVQEEFTKRQEEVAAETAPQAAETPAAVG